MVDIDYHSSREKVIRDLANSLVGLSKLASNEAGFTSIACVMTVSAGKKTDSPA